MSLTIIHDWTFKGTVYCGPRLCNPAELIITTTVGVIPQSSCFATLILIIQLAYSSWHHSEIFSEPQYYYWFWREGFILLSPGCLGTHYKQDWPQTLRDLSASACQLLGIKACATIAGPSLSSWGSVRNVIFIFELSARTYCQHLSSLEALCIQLFMLQIENSLIKGAIVSVHKHKTIECHMFQAKSEWQISSKGLISHQSWVLDKGYSTRHAFIYMEGAWS